MRRVTGIVYSHQGTSSNGSVDHLLGHCQDAGSNPGSGKRFDFSMTSKFVKIKTHI